MKRVLIAGILCTLWLSGCAKYHYLKFDQYFSINLAKPGSKWPNRNKMTEAEKALLDERGAPDYIRVWWSNEDRIVQFMEVHARMNKLEHLERKQSWIYVDSQEEVVFKGESDFFVRPLSDKLKIVSTYGDPDLIKIEEQSEDKSTREIWQYYSAGKIFTFHDERLTREQTTQKMGKKLKT